MEGEESEHRMKQGWQLSPVSPTSLELSAHYTPHQAQEGDRGTQGLCACPSPHGSPAEQGQCYAGSVVVWRELSCSAAPAPPQGSRVQSFPSHQA